MINSNTTALQNLVVAFNNSTKATASVAGQTTSITYIGAAESSVNSGPCRLVNVCVVEGSGMVKFYNSQSGNALPADSLLFVLTSAAPIGVTPVGLNFNLGLYIVVEAGVSVNCTYSVA